MSWTSGTWELCARMTAFLSCFKRRISAASSPCPLNWSIWATEDQTRQGQIPVLNITLWSVKEEGASWVIASSILVVFPKAGMLLHHWRLEPCDRGGDLVNILFQSGKHTARCDDADDSLVL